MTPKGLLIDINGVLVDAWRPIPGAIEALAALRSTGRPLRFLTNATASSAEVLADRLVELGFTVTAPEMFTAPVATARFLLEHHPTAAVHVLNDGDLGADFDNVHIEADPARADVVVLGGAGPRFTHEALSAIFRRVIAGAPLIAMHSGLYWKAEPGLLLDTGAFLVGIEKAAGVEATVLGKPSPDFFAAALDDMALSAADVMMIGDDLDNDVLAAQDLGMTGTLVRTGKFRQELLDERFGEPTHVVDSIADVADLLK